MIEPKGEEGESMPTKKTIPDIVREHFPTVGDDVEKLAQIAQRQYPELEIRVIKSRIYGPLAALRENKTEGKSRRGGASAAPATLGERLDAAIAKVQNGMTLAQEGLAELQAMGVEIGAMSDRLEVLAPFEAAMKAASEKASKQ